ncbi:MAG: Lrp/AsnC family transcriptional regulator [Rhizobiales bacterium]|nr:Lrp/AsnC family transcriptional regulator [Hyphomicrobiales bacterium]
MALLPDPLEPATQQLIDACQRDFPLVAQPFAAIGAPLGLDEAEVRRRLADLIAAGAATRLGAVVRPHAAGASTLAALAAPAGRIEEIARIVGGFAGVNHNYERESAWNLWFVVTGANEAEVAGTLSAIVRETGLAVLDLPLERAYHIDLGFDLFRAPRARAAPRPLRRPADEADRRVLAQIERGLPFVSRPYAEVAARLGVAEAEVIARLAAMVADGVIVRFGLVVRHQFFGYRANAMAVWDVADERVDEIGALFAGESRVTLCYRRPRRPPGWRFNLFTMVHARTREDALGVVERLAAQAQGAVRARDVFFSLRCFKQRGARFSAAKEAAE